MTLAPGTSAGVNEEGRSGEAAAALREMARLIKK
jgi:hypothetical protein